MSFIIRITLEWGMSSWKFHTVLKNIEDYISGKFIAWFQFFMDDIFFEFLKFTFRPPKSRLGWTKYLIYFVLLIC